MRMRSRFVARKNNVPEPPPEQQWVVWQIDDEGDEWTMGFAPTRAKARRAAWRLNEASRNRWRRERWRRNKEARA